MLYTVFSDHKFRRICNQELFKKAHQDRFEMLTRREKEIIHLVAVGNNSLEIAERLFISRFTVEQHRKNINKKLMVHSVSQLYQYALAFDLV